MASKKLTEQEKNFTDKAWQLAESKKELSEFDIEKAGLEIVAYFQKRFELTGELTKGNELRRLRGMVYLILDELEGKRK